MSFIFLRFPCLFLKSSWTDEDIYPDDTNPGYSLDGKDRNSQYFASGLNIYIHDCVFHDIHGSQAITYSSGGKMLVELSIFKNCTSESDGGCVYQSSGNFVMNKCCGVRCYTPSNSGQFVYTSLASGRKNNVLDSSISLSYNGDSGCYSSTLDLQYGNIIVKTVNLSKNKCQWNAAFACSPSSNGTSSVSFASINENNSTSRTCFFGRPTNGHELVFSNIINNQCSDSNFGIIYTNNPLCIKNCCILENIATIWFHCIGSTISIISCTINEEDVAKTIGPIATNSWKPSFPFINAIEFTKNGDYCEASFDAVGTLTANLHTKPMKTYNIYQFNYFHIRWRL